MERTTIQVSKQLKKKLESLKTYPRETLGSVIERLADTEMDKEPLTKEDVKAIRESLKDIEAGRYYTTEQLEKKLGI